MNDKDETAATNKWELCEPSLFKGIPLGLTPEQTAESLYLAFEPEKTHAS